MKHLLTTLIFLSAILFQSHAISPYYSFGSTNGTIEDAANNIKKELTSNEFEILGEYHPGNDKNLYVIVFTSMDLKKNAVRVNDRGLLGGALRIGLQKEGNSIKMSAVNPDYMFHAYFRTAMDNKSLRPELEKISNKVKSTLRSINGELSGFGGDESEEDLHKYRYMMGMPYFTDPVELANFESFEEGLKIIRDNLNAGKNATVKIYENIHTGKKVAVFGIGLLDKEKGEDHFLSIIGKEHVAAMPYEIILMDTKATMLHGRYRFALYWPELTMGTFTKIMSTPGDVEEAMEAVVMK